MPLTTLVSGDLARASHINDNFALCVLTDTSRTVTVTHTYTASQTFTGGWTAAAACTISSGGIAVTGNSTVTGTLTATSTIAAGAGTSLRFTGSSRINDESDGIVTVSNSAGTGFTRLNFGGTTTSFPALKRSSAALAVRLGDDSADAALTAAAITASGLITGSAGVTVASGQTLTLTGATVAGAPTWSSSQAITLSTAAQPNITSVGTLTSLSVGAVTSTGQIKTTLTTQQLALHYDASNHLAVTVASDGGVTFNATGASAGFTFSDGVTLSAALTYGGVTLSNAVTGTGNMVLSASPTLTGTVATAALTASGLITGSAGVTVASGQTLTLTGATVAGTPTWSSSQAITLSTASQPNITSVGTLTSLALSGAVTGSNSTDGEYANTFTNANAGTAAEATIYVRNAASAAAGVALGVTGTGFTTAGGFVQDAAYVSSGSSLSGGFSLISRAGDVRIYAGGHTNLIGTWSTTGLAMNSLVISGVSTLTATTLAGTLSTAAQTNITSVGTLTSLGVGAITSTGLIQTTLTTEQMRLRYDATHYVSTTVASGGDVTYFILGTGGSNQNYTFAGDVVSGTTVNVDGGVKTNLPGTTDGTMGSRWLLGSAAAVSPTSPNRTLSVSVGGTTYYIHAKTTND